MTRIIMRGCNGKMGQVISQLVSEDNDAQIVAGIDFVDDKENGYPVFPSLMDCTVKADVMIDFASIKGFDEVIEYVLEKKLPVVLCTTGYTTEQLELIKETSKTVAILKSANMSLGVNILFKLVQEAAKVLASENYDIEIIEKHHNQKVDAPSGTALALADSMNEVLNGEYVYNYDRSRSLSKREKKEIGISAVRGGTIVGEHEIIFAGIDEVIELKHTAYSKAIFAKGAISAAKFLSGKDAGLYDMSHVIG